MLSLEVAGEASLAPTLTAPTLESEKEEQMVARLEKPQEVKELLDPDLEAVTLKLICLK